MPVGFKYKGTCLLEDLKKERKEELLKKGIEPDDETEQEDDNTSKKALNLERQNTSQSQFRDEVKRYIPDNLSQTGSMLAL